MSSNSVLDHLSKFRSVSSKSCLVHSKLLVQMNRGFFLPNKIYHHDRDTFEICWLNTNQQISNVSL